MLEQLGILPKVVAVAGVFSSLLTVIFFVLPVSLFGIDGIWLGVLSFCFTCFLAGYMSAAYEATTGLGFPFGFCSAIVSVLVQDLFSTYRDAPYSTTMLVVVLVGGFVCAVIGAATQIPPEDVMEQHGRRLFE